MRGGVMMGGNGGRGAIRLEIVLIPSCDITQETSNGTYHYVLLSLFSSLLILRCR